MLVADKLGFPVEWSLAGAMLTKKQLAPAVEFEQNRASAIAAHYAEHGLVPPPAVGRAITGATENLDEVTEGDSRASVRFRGPVRLATYAVTEAQCLEQARALVDAYGDRANFDLAHPRGQAQLLREFVPGEPWSTVGYQRRIPATLHGGRDAARQLRGRHPDRALSRLRHRVRPPGDAAGPALRDGEAAAVRVLHHHRRTRRRQERADRCVGVQRGPPRRADHHLGPVRTARPAGHHARAERIGRGCWT